VTIFLIVGTEANLAAFIVQFNCFRFKSYEMKRLEVICR